MNEMPRYVVEPAFLAENAAIGEHDGQRRYRHDCRQRTVVARRVMAHELHRQMDGAPVLVDVSRSALSISSATSRSVSLRASIAQELAGWSCRHPPSSLAAGEGVGLRDRHPALARQRAVDVASRPAHAQRRHRRPRRSCRSPAATRHREPAASDQRARVAAFGLRSARARPRSCCACRAAWRRLQRRR